MSSFVNGKSWNLLRNRLISERDRAKVAIGPDHSLHVVKLVEAAAFDQALGIMLTIESDGREVREQAQELESRAMGLVKDFVGDLGPHPVTYELRSLLSAALSGDEARLLYHRAQIALNTSHGSTTEATTTLIAQYMAQINEYFDIAMALNAKAGRSVFC